MSENLIDHPTDSDLWRHDPPSPGKCYVCEDFTQWVELDIGYRHEDCEIYPTIGGTVRIVRGVRHSTSDWRAAL